MLISSARPATLQLIVRGGFVENLRRAISEGLDVNHQCENGKMALNYAEDMEGREIVQVLRDANAVSRRHPALTPSAPLNLLG